MSYPPVVEHTHTWDSGVVTTAATCNKSGVKTYTCVDCGETKTEEILATDEHTWGKRVVTTRPSYGMPGVGTYTCTVCGATRTEQIAPLPMLDHGDDDDTPAIPEVPL